MEIVSASHVDMKDKVLDPDPRVCSSVLCLYIHGFKSFQKLMIQYLIGEAQGVCGTPVFGRVMAYCRRLLIPSWYSINMIVFGGFDPTAEHFS